MWPLIPVSEAESKKQYWFIDWTGFQSKKIKEFN